MADTVFTIGGRSVAVPELKFIHLERARGDIGRFSAAEGFIEQVSTLARIVAIAALPALPAPSLDAIEAKADEIKAALGGGEIPGFITGALSLLETSGLVFKAPTSGEAAPATDSTTDPSGT